MLWHGIFLVDIAYLFYIIATAMNDTKKILMSVAMFIIAMHGAGAQSVDELSDINAQIRQARDRIETVRLHRTKFIKKKLERNPDYRYVVERSAEINKLRLENERLIERACDIVRRKNRPQTVLVVKSPMVFMLYSSKYTEVGLLHSSYQFNRRQIELYERRLEKIDGMEQRVKNHYDSIMHAEIDRHQLMIDSLLTRKMQLVK